jgi:hypothetical protein
MKPADGLHLLLLSEGAVLFDEAAQKLFHLNTSAAFIWCQLVEGLDEQTIKIELQEMLTITAPNAETYLQASFTFFKKIGVIKGFEKTQRIKITATTETHLSYDKSAFIDERNYRLLSSSFCIRYTTNDQLLLVDSVLHHLRNNDLLSSCTYFDIIQGEDGRIYVCQDNLTRLSCDGDAQLAPLVKSLIWQAAVNKHDYFLNIHAGVVSDGKQCYVFPAGSGSGKSTLTAALVQQGFEYYSDETALIHEPEFHVESVPLALCVKDSGVEVLSRYYPHLPQLTVHHRSDGKKVRYLAPPTNLSVAINTRQPISAIIFPHYCPTHITSLEPMSSLHALQALMQECLIVDKCLNKDNVSSLLSWIENTPCYSLKIGNLEEALMLVRKLSTSNDS